MSEHTCGTPPSMSCSACMEEGDPEHLLIPVNAEGEGPADPEDAVAEVCWCGIPGCAISEVYRGFAIVQVRAEGAARWVVQANPYWTLAAVGTPAEARTWIDAEIEKW